MPVLKHTLVSFSSTVYLLLVSRCPFFHRPYTLIPYVVASQSIAEFLHYFFDYKSDARSAAFHVCSDAFCVQGGTFCVNNDGTVVSYYGVGLLLTCFFGACQLGSITSSNKYHVYNYFFYFHWFYVSLLHTWHFFAYYLLWLHPNNYTIVISVSDFRQGRCIIESIVVTSSIWLTIHNNH
jgi:hypothetical protein